MSNTILNVIPNLQEDKGLQYLKTQGLDRLQKNLSYIACDKAATLRSNFFSGLTERIDDLFAEYVSHWVYDIDSVTQPYIVTLEVPTVDYFGYTPEGFLKKISVMLIRHGYNVNYVHDATPIKVDITVTKVDTTKSYLEVYLEVEQLKTICYDALTLQYSL